MASRTPTALTLATGVNTWTNMPLAQTEFLGVTAYRVLANLADFDKVRLCARVTTVGVAGAVLAVQYSTDETTWNTLGNTVPISALGTLAGAWADIPAGAKADVFLRLGGQGGNAVADPVIGLVMLQLYSVPTIERAGLLTQLIANAYGLTRDMRDNANSYKAAVAAGQVPVATIAATMRADANQYVTRIGWITTLFSNNNATANAALGDAGLTLAQATALRDTLLTVANHTLAADLSTGAAINTEADFQLANVPSYARLW